MFFSQDESRPFVVGPDFLKLKGSSENAGAQLSPGEGETSALLGRRAGPVDPQRVGSCLPPPRSVKWEETNHPRHLSPPCRVLATPRLQVPPACTPIHMAPAPRPPAPTLLICLSLKPVYDSLEEADGRVDRKEKALALHRSGLESPMVSQLRLDLEQATFPLCASVSSAVIETPGSGPGSYRRYLFTSFQSCYHGEEAGRGGEQELRGYWHQDSQGSRYFFSRENE